MSVDRVGSLAHTMSAKEFFDRGDKIIKMGGKGSGGHNRKSIENHQLDGTYRKDRHGKHLMAKWKSKIDPSMPQCPGWFDPIAREEWNRVAPKLYQAGLLTMLDHAALEAYCIAYSMVVRAVKEINKGLTVSTFDPRSREYKKAKRPEVKIAIDCLNLTRQFCREFGLTASSRGQMVLPGEDKRSEMEKLLDKMEGKSP